MRKILLISISGADKPGITEAVSEVLMCHKCDILDISQSVIHDNLNPGLLARTQKVWELYYRKSYILH